MKKIILISFFIIQTSFGQSSTSPWNKTQWAAEGEIEYARAFNQFDAYFNTNNSTPYDQPRYYDFRVYDANLALFQATGDYIYLDRNIYFIDKLIGLASPTTASSVWNDGYYDWEEDGTATQLNDAHGTRNIFKMIWVMRKYPSIRATAMPGGGTYQDKYDEYLDFFEENVFEKWESRGCRWILRGYSWMASHLGANAAMYLHMIYKADGNITKSNYYMDWVNAWNTDTGSMCNHSDAVDGVGFRDILTIAAHGGYSFNGQWTQASTAASDFSHANAGVQAVVNQYLLGTHGDTEFNEWTSTDIQRFINTLNALLDNSPDSDYLNLPEYMDAVYDAADDNRNTIVYGWSRLAAFDQTLYNRLNDLNGNTLKAFYYYYNFCAQMAYNYAYLNDTMVYPEYSIESLPPTVTDVNKKRRKLYNSMYN